MITLSVMTTISLPLPQLKTLTNNLHFQSDFSLSLWHIAFQQKCLSEPGFLIYVLYPFLSFAVSGSREHFSAF